jgi:hypothetical protein
MSQTPDPLLGVTIQSREIYDAVVRLTGRVDVLITQHDESRTDIKDHEMRIRQLESNRWPLQSISLVVAAAALVVTFVKNFL